MVDELLEYASQETTQNRSKNIERLVHSSSVSSEHSSRSYVPIPKSNSLSNIPFGIIIPATVIAGLHIYNSYIGL